MANHIQVLSSLLSTVKQNELNALLGNLRQSFRDSFKTTARDYERTAQELRAVRNRLRLAEANADDPIVQVDQTKKTEIDRKIEELDEQVIQLTVKIEQCRADIVVNGRRLSELRQKLKVAAANKEGNEHCFAGPVGCRIGRAGQ